MSCKIEYIRLRARGVSSLRLVPMTILAVNEEVWCDKGTIHD